ncbi:MAG TPA: DUF3109 family protein [Dysgonamonadaceae bacterium]|jgi:hypothetical protein|nr:DUF3109 family protein [Dysgonamonadaceae bacterium]
MIQIKDTLISEDIFETCFVCDLGKCKGMCCVEGDAGAPLTHEEYEAIKDVLPEIWDDLSPKARELIEKQGIAYIDDDGELVTSIIKGRECVFTYFDADGVCRCAIDNAFREGKISVQKPISCHLYPIRLRKYDDFTALNYDRWSVCRPALRLGKKTGIKLYQFLKEPLIRKFGEEWYQEVCQIAELLPKTK